MGYNEPYTQGGYTGLLAALNMERVHSGLHCGSLTVEVWKLKE